MVKKIYSKGCNLATFERLFLGIFIKVTPKSTPCQSSDQHFLGTKMQLWVL